MEGLFDPRTLLPAGLPPVGALTKGARAGKAPQRGGGCEAVPGRAAASPAAEPAGPRPEAAAWVRTDEDAVKYFSEAGNTAVKLFFCNRADPAGGFRPYDLVVVGPKAASREEHFTISPREVLRFARGEPAEALPLEEWVWQKRCWERLRQKAFFCKYCLAKYFFFWWKTVRQARLRRTQQQLERAAFLATPTFCGALLEIGALMDGLRGIQACGLRGGRVYRLGELVEQLGAWRERKARPEVEEAVGKIRKVAEGVCAAVEQRAQQVRESVKDPAELEDRVGVDLTASTTAARAKSMWVIKQEKIARARSFHTALAEVDLLPAFLRLVDAMLAEALGALAVDSLAGAVRTLEGTAGGLAGEAAAGGLGEGSAEAEAEVVTAEGQEAAAAAAVAAAATVRSGMLFTDVVFGAGGTEFSPSQGEWADALQQQLVEATEQLAAGVAPLASLPVFAKYFQAGAPEAAGGGAFARSSPMFQACCQRLLELLEGAYTQATAFAMRYDAQRPLHDFHAAFDPELYSRKQRSELDLGEVRRDLATLQQWRAQLDSMRSSAAVGCLQVDARALRASLEPMATGAAEHIQGMLLALARELCQRRLEDLHLRLHVTQARPAEMEDFVAWQEQVAEVQAAKEEVLRRAAEVDDCYDVLLLHGVKIPTQDQVKHDDLREGAARLVEQLEGCAAFIADQAPGHRDSVQASAKSLVDEAILLEESLKHGMYVDDAAEPADVVADLEAVAERVAQMQAAAGDLRAFQAALGLAQEGFEAVEDAGREASARLELWRLVQRAQQCAAERAQQLQLAQRRGVASPEPGEGAGTAAADSGSLLSAVSLSTLETVLAGIAAEVAEVEAQLAVLHGVDATDPVRMRAAALLGACRS